MRTIEYMISVVFLLLTAGTAPAQNQPVNAGTGDLGVLLRLAKENNQLLQSERLEVEARRARALEAGLRANPVLTGSAMQELAGGDNYLGAGLSQSLELFGRRQARRAAALAGVDVARLETVEKEQILAGQIRTLYGKILAQQRDLDVLRQILESNYRTYQVVQERVGQGIAPALEDSLQMVEIRRVEARVAVMEGRRDASVLELKTLLSLAPDQPLRLDADLESAIQIPPMAQAVTESLSRAEIQRAQADEKAALAEAERARAEAKYDISVSAEYRRSDAGFGVRGFNAAGQLRPVQGIFHMLMGAANITLPLFDRNQGEIAEFQIRAEQARKRQRFLEAAVRNELSSAYRRLEKLREGQRAYTEGVLRLSSDNLEVVKKKYELGASPLADVLQEQRRSMDLQMEYTQILAELYRAQSDILNSLGRTE